MKPVPRVKSSLASKSLLVLSEVAGDDRRVKAAIPAANPTVDPRNKPNHSFP